MIWTIRIRSAIIIALVVLAIGIGVVRAGVGQISRPVPGGVTINLLPPHASADIDGNGKIDAQDLLAITGKLNTLAVGDAREDTNHDGVIDVVDLAFVARFLGLEA